MGHKPNQDSTAVKKSEKHQAELARTPEQRLSAIRGSLAAKLFVTPDDQRFLLALYDQALSAIIVAGVVFSQQQQEIADLQAKLEEFRTVYEQENSSTSVKVERVLLPNAGPGIDQQVPGGPSF